MTGQDQAAICARLSAVPTATLSSQLIKRGIRNCFVRGASRLVGATRICGPAFTLRFVAGREDLCPPESYGWEKALPAAVDAAPTGSILVVSAEGHPAAGTFGDIFATSLKARGILGVVSDGAIRDLPGLCKVGLPFWGSGTTPPPSIGGLAFAGWGDMIGCGGTAIVPGDFIVADEDGVVVVPAALATEVAEGGEAQEAFESWVLGQAVSGRPLVGLYPADEETLAAYEAWKSGRS